MMLPLIISFSLIIIITFRYARFDYRSSPDAAFLLSMLLMLRFIFLPSFALHRYY